MNRILGRFTKSISRPGQMFPLGFLFGLGFDTATEVTLMVMAGSGAAAGLPWYAILCLPLLFAAGMSLFDTLDGTFMNFAYQWAFSNPVRKVYYNLTITGLSIAVALLHRHHRTGRRRSTRSSTSPTRSAAGSPAWTWTTSASSSSACSWWSGRRRSAYWRLAKVEQKWAGTGA